MSPKIERALAKPKYERAEANAARRLLQREDTVLELGAGLGFMSAILRRETSVGRIVTYEANPNLIDYILAVHRSNGLRNIEVRNAIVLPNPTEPTIPFHIRADMWSSSLSADRSPKDGGVTRTVDVPVVAWSDVIAEIQPTALVMDIEGAELDLMTACDPGPIRRMVIELHPDVYGVSGMAQIFTAFDRHGFQYAPTDSKGNVLSLQR
jgi:FkbM family methyltransferase